MSLSLWNDEASRSSRLMGFFSPHLAHLHPRLHIRRPTVYEVLFFAFYFLQAPQFFRGLLQTIATDVGYENTRFLNKNLSRQTNGRPTVPREQIFLPLLIYSMIVISLSLAFANSSLYLCQILALGGLSM